MQLTEFFEDDVYNQMVKSLQRITRGIAISDQFPQRKCPEVILDDHYLPPVSNSFRLLQRELPLICRML
ncbi:MAG: hypothetical protein R2744_12735 [Bacteroidales bacterium]